MNNCSGPCLQHCYSKSKIEYILIGIAIGLAISYILHPLRFKMRQINVKK